MRPGPRNLITDVAGLRVGNAADARLKSGVTVLTADAPFAAAVHVMGGAPGTRDTDLLAPDKTVQAVDALFLSGGSAFGLDAGGGIMAGLRAAGRGFAVGGARVPIVPGAIVFDLLNGGDKDWTDNPYPALGREALAAAASQDFAIGNYGAGTGTRAGRWKGGLGSASAVLDGGAVFGALAVANARGDPTAPSGQFWAAPWEMEGEFGGLGLGGRFAPEAEFGAAPAPNPNPREATTIAIVATDLALDKAALQRMAIAAHDGIARAVVPAHTPFDGDLVFAVSTGARQPTDHDRLLAGHVAACCLARAIARAVYLATPAPGDPLPCWSPSAVDPRR